MEDVYTLGKTPEIKIPIRHEEHHRLLTSSIVILALSLVIGFGYIFYSRPEPAEPISPISDKVRADVASLLARTQANASEDDIDRIASQFSGVIAKDDTGDRERLSALLTK